MKAICVTPERSVEAREIETPETAPPGHLLLQMEASAINHGDKAFLARNLSASLGTPARTVWGASGVGRVIARGDGVAEVYAGRTVAVYRSLQPTPETIGLWSQRAVVHPLSCVVLPDGVRPRDYCGSLVNVITPYAFLEQIAEDGHAGVVVTAGGSATGLALDALARRRGVGALHLVRDDETKAALSAAGVAHALALTEPEFDTAFAALAERLGATAVFDGVGGALIGRLAPLLPANATIYGYGFLGGPTPLGLTSLDVMLKNLTIRRFSNFESPTVKDPARLARALTALGEVIGDAAFHTRIGREFGYDEIAAAMAYEAQPGAKAVLVA